MRATSAFFVCGTMLLGCFGSVPTFTDDDSPSDALADAPGDAPPPDARMCVPDTTECDDDTGHLVVCSSAGTPTLEMDCGIGCSTTSEQCVEVSSSNGYDSYLDQSAAAGEIEFSGDSSIDTNSGAVFNGPTSISVPSAVVGSARVYMFKSLKVSGTLRATGGRMLVLISYGDVTIDGTLDISSDVGGLRGPGANNGPNCPTLFGVQASGSVSPGAAGGAMYEAGGAGGASGDGTAGQSGPFGNNDVDQIPLGSGCGGAGVTEASPVCTAGSSYGGGGLQIVSRTEIRVIGSGVIDASGAGGRSWETGSGCTSVGGGGGGSGGALLLEAPQVTLDGAAVIISTKGGGGAAAGHGCGTCRGADGGTSGTPAAGGTNGAQAAGGAGSIATTAAGIGASGASGQDGGGGGGGSGYVRFNTSGGGVSPQGGATIRSAYSAGSVGTRLRP